MMDLLLPTKPARVHNARLVNGAAFVDEAPPKLKYGKKVGSRESLTRIEVVAIRAKHAAWRKRYDEWLAWSKQNDIGAIAAQFDLTKSYVHRIVCRDVWSDGEISAMNSRAKPQRHCAWFSFGLGAEQFIACPVVERALLARSLYKASWSWAKRNKNKRVFRCAPVEGGVRVKRVV